VPLAFLVIAAGLGGVDFLIIKALERAPLVRRLFGIAALPA
jgi:hypothetical protein